MENNIVYHNRNIKTEDIAYIKELIANNPIKAGDIYHKSYVVNGIGDKKMVLLKIWYAEECF